MILYMHREVVSVNIHEYMKLPYSYIIKPISDGNGSRFHAAVLELDGCQSTGGSFDDAYSNLMAAMEDWIKTKLENGVAIPPPLDTDRFSGKFIVRLPKSLHARLAMEAKKEGVSLNQYTLHKLSV